MTNYQLGKIYRIVDNVTGKEYIGSTCEPTLARRLVKHRGVFNLFQNGKGRFITSFTILENDNYEICLIENFPCNSKDELHQRERFYIENNDCVNKNIPNRKANEYYIDNKVVILEYQKQYYKNKKDVINERNKEYYNENKEVINEQKKEYCKINKEEIKEYQTQYRKDNKDKIKQYKKQYRETKKALKTETV